MYVFIFVWLQVFIYVCTYDYVYRVYTYELDVFSICMNVCMSWSHNNICSNLPQRIPSRRAVVCRRREHCQSIALNRRGIYCMTRWSKNPATFQICIYWHIKTFKSESFNHFMKSWCYFDYAVDCYSLQFSRPSPLDWCSTCTRKHLWEDFMYKCIYDLTADDLFCLCDVLSKVA